ncbi:DUF2989 domain-containing protein [Colwelliaceae bacterium 6441]
MKISIYLSIAVFFIGTGCDSAPNFAQLCEENPKICYEFHEDSWCKRERIAVGAANIAHKQNPDDLQKFHQLIAYEKYNKCVTHASKIEHIKLKEKKSFRIENMMKSRDRIAEIAEQTINSDHPRLLYFHWTRYLNEQSLNKFLALEGSKALETPESQYELATYYAKIDQDKTLQLLFHSLELHEENVEINVEIFKTLSSIFADKKQFKQSYIWLKILNLYAPLDPDISENTLKNYRQSYNLKGEFLDKVAQSTLDKIKDSTFISPKF